MRDDDNAGHRRRGSIGELTAAAIAAEAEWLAKGDDARFMNEVALRMQDPS